MKSQIIHDIWQRKSVVFTLAMTDLKLRYRSSVLGILWTFLEPLLILTILFVVFSSILKNDIPNFPIFLLLGIIFFQTFSRSTGMGIDSILGRAGVVSSINISRIVFPLASSLTSLYMMAFEFLILFGFMIAFQFTPTLTILFLPVLLILLFILGLGLAIPLSVLNVHYRDVRSIWTIVLQAAFFLTPIFYKLDFLPEPIRQVVQFSPLAQIVKMSHEVVLENKLPDPAWFLYTVFSIFAIFMIGILVYKKYKVNLVERL